MTDREWRSICFFIDNAWHGDFDDDKRDAYRFFLDKFAPDQVMAALEALTETGDKFVPAAAEIVQTARRLEDPPVPAWPEVWRHLLIALRKYTEQEALDHLNEVHPVVTAFLQAEGFKRLKEFPLLDPQYGPLREKELRERWEEFVAVASERLARSRALEAIGARKGLGPTRLDQAALVERLRPDSAGELESGEGVRGGEDNPAHG